MPLNINIGLYIEYTNENGTYHFFKGDKVTCYTKEKKYTGVIDFIGHYRETEETGYESAIYLDTSDSKTSLSGEIIKLKDITSIYKTPFSNDKNPFADEEGFVNILLEKGYDSEKARAISGIMNAAAVFYITPLSKATGYATQAVADIDKNEDMTDEKRKDIVMEFARECAAMAIDEYLDLADMFLREIGKEKKLDLRFSDVFSVVSKCWDDLIEQNRDKIMKISEKMRSNS